MTKMQKLCLCIGGPLDGHSNFYVGPIMLYHQPLKLEYLKASRLEELPVGYPNIREHKYMYSEGNYIYDREME